MSFHWIGPSGKMLTEMGDAFDSFDVRYDVRSIGLLGDGATVFGKVFISARSKENGELLRREVWETLVFRRDGGKWRLVQEHSTTAAPNDAAAR